MNTKQLIKGVVVGGIATFIMDCSVIFSKILGLSQVQMKYDYMGRWLLHLIEGNFAHRDIRSSEVLGGEFIAGVLLHYGIGAILGVAYLIFWEYKNRSATIILPLLFGLSTCILPWLILYPSMGYGLAGLNGIDGASLLAYSISGHFFYGFGLYLSQILIEASKNRGSELPNNTFSVIDSEKLMISFSEIKRLKWVVLLFSLTVLYMILVLLSSKK
jgi:hypothetical protein